MTVFLACPRHMDVFQVIDIKQKIENLLPSVPVTTSKEDFEQNFTECGSWDNWIDRVVKGRSYLTQKDNYQMVILSDKILGRATMSIVKGFLGKKKQVTYFDIDQNKLINVSSVEELDGENWQGGWTAVLAA